MSTCKRTSLEQIASSLAHLVVIDQKRLDIEIKSMTPAIVNALIAALAALTTLIQTDVANVAAAQAAQAAAEQALADLQATDAALQDPALVDAANAAIAAAAAVTPAPVEPPAEPAAA